MKPVPMCVFVGLLLSFGILFITAADLTDDEKQMANKIDTHVKKVMDCLAGPGITLSVVKSGKTILSQGYGIKRNPKTGKDDVKVTSKTRFAIGSLTKAFTGLLAVKLVSESKGAITVDTPIHEYIPGFRVTDDIRSKEASLKDLLAHRMGIAGYMFPFLMGFPHDVTRDELVRRMPHLPSKAPFRQKYIYNNYMYILAGQVLEQLADGKSWEDLVRDVIFRPLNMSNSGFLTDANPFVDFALPCYKEKNGSVTDISTDVFSTYHLDGPAGSIYSNADDMTKWMNLMLSKDEKIHPPGLGPLITKQTFNAGIRLTDTEMGGFFKPDFPVSHFRSTYALGWQQKSYRGYRQIMHSGVIVTHGSRLWLYPDLEAGIFISGRGGLNLKEDTLYYILYYASDLLLGESPWFNATSACHSNAPWRKAGDTAEKVEEWYVGTTFDPITEAISNFTATGTSITPANYVGNYTHPFFGAVHINSCADGSKTSPLCLYYGKPGGWLSLGALSETTFAGRVEGDLTYLDPKRRQYMMTLIFSLNNRGPATSLELFMDPTAKLQFKRLE